MTHSSPTSTNSNMDHESTLKSSEIRTRNERPTLPPILPMNSYLTSGSWPPPSSTLPSTSLLSPSIASTSSNITMQDSSSILSSPLRRNTHLYDQWSPRNEEYQPRADYFSSSSPSSSYQRTGHAFSPYSSTNSHPHYRQNSAPQLSSFQHEERPSRSPNESNFGYGPSGSKLSLAPIPAPYDNTREDNNRNSNSPIELVMSLNSLSTPTLRNIEKDIDQVIMHCHSLSDNMQEKKHSVVEDESYFSDSTITSPWLDEMIKKANEILNALLRLRKYQLAAEHARIHRHQSIEGQNNDGWSASKSSTTSANSVMSLNTHRTRKRGKRPVFQGRCHSCNISETPEWRRGPDGARTLCNACGLHYAKLTKKKNKQEEANKEATEQDKEDTSMK